MKKILFGLALLISFSVNAQIRVCQLPQVTSGTLNDYIIKEDSTCHGTRKIKISDFIATYSLGGGGGSTDTTSLSNRINNKIDTLYKNSTGDSFIYKINGRRHALVDSVGSSTGSVSPIESSWTDALGRIGLGSIVAGQAYKVNNDDLNLPAGVDYILIWGLDANTYNSNAQIFISEISSGVLGQLEWGYYNIVDNQVRVSLIAEGTITQSGGGNPTVENFINEFKGVTFGANYDDVGSYSLAPSVALSGRFTFIVGEIHGEALNAGLDVQGIYSACAGYYDTAFDVFRFGSQDFTETASDGLLNRTPFRIKATISN